MLKADQRSRLERRGPPVRLADVAKRTGVAISSVSRVLSGNFGKTVLSQETVKRVRREAARLGYRPNLAARALRSGDSHLVAVFGGDFHDVFSNVVRNAVDIRLRQSGLIPMHIPWDENLVLGTQSVHLLEAVGVRRAIFLATPQTPSAELTKIIRRVVRTVVAVGFSARVPGFAGIEIDESQAADLLFEHLSQLGHQDVCVQDGPKTFAVFRHRSAAWRAAASRLGIGVSALGSHYPEIASCVKAWGDKLKNTTAVVAYDDEAAIRILHVAQALGIRVPDALSVTGFDNIPAASQCWPPLTTIAQPVEAMAAQSIELLQSHKPARVVLKTTLVRRQSTGQPSAS